ncbi:uncharacterized protein LOC105161355 isoform X2 [Sesamum indicum]|uniref:Uncharacterized protein LOC105161355 isoform X2 n=1 Tax=Sesamum indicum TaxID=4182 RepID=A0A8M8UZS0_SESIN|nr:uncharacterized protein LOC105161355 isoform X2 [Sesamum indicum]
MEGISCPHLFINHSSRGSEPVNVENMAADQDDCSSLFINYAAIAWHEMRRAWRGDQSVASERKPREPIMSQSASYQDVVSPGERFNEPVPLAMVKSLVEIWGEGY